MARKPVVIGAAELNKAFDELGDMSSSEWKSTLNRAVRGPMTKVRKQAAANLSLISPGKAAYHWTYRGNLVSAGFAARSLMLKVVVVAKKGMAYALLGVKTEAFYVLSFIELGTSTIPRHPWLTPALEASKDTAVSDVGKAMRQRILSIAKKRNKPIAGGGK